MSLPYETCQSMQIADAIQPRWEILNILIKHEYQELSKYALTQAMSEEYKMHVEEAKYARRY